MTETLIVLPKPLPHQIAPLLSPSRWKVWNWGRRTGKSRGKLVAAVCGHGPCDANGIALRRGVVHGGDVVWLAPDYKQAGTIWEEEIRPRMDGLEGVRLDNQDHDVEFPNGGRLLIRSAENPNAVRGSGKRLLGVLLDEFAHVPGGYERGRYVWRSAVRPALMDCGGWAIWGSTPKRGSFFNERALEAKRKTRAGWEYVHMDARANPMISAAEFAELVSEYTAESDELREEVYAELLEGGAGLAFPEFTRAVLRPDGTSAPVHVQPPLRAMPPGWRFAAGLDWGYAKRNGAYVLAAFGPDGRVRVVHERVFGEQHAADAAQAIMGASAHWPRPEFIAADEAMWHDGNSVGSSVAEEFLRGLRLACGTGAPILREAPHRAGSRLARKNLLHRLLAYRAGEDGTLTPWDAPRLTISGECAELIGCLEKLPRDPKRPEDVDTTAFDHPYDALTYLLASDPPQGLAPAAALPQDRHPGFGPNGERRAAPVAPWEQQVMTRLDEPPAAGGLGYQQPRTWEAW